MEGPFDALPLERRDFARSAVQAAFGRAELTALQPIAGGISALTYRFEVAGRAYVLRLEGPSGGIRDPQRSYACMAAAAEAGVAPPLHHADPQAGVAIMDFIAAQPIEHYPGGASALAGDMGRLLGSLQATAPCPPFAPFQLLLDRMLAYVEGAALFTPGLLDPHREAFVQLSTAYPWGRLPTVSSHNDPNPRNVIFDGRRLWLIDWETAFRNDPLVDLAIVANDLASTPEITLALCSGWRRGPPDRMIGAQLLVMRQLTRLYYALLVLSALASSPPAAPDDDLTAPTVDAFRAAFAEGRLRVGDSQVSYILAKMNLAGFLAGFATPQVQQALTLLQG